MTSGPEHDPLPYTRNQRIGLMMLVVFLGAATVFSHFFPIRAWAYEIDETEFFAAAERIRASTELATGAGPQVKKAFAAFRFDPNTVSQGELEQLGLSPKQATAWIRYRSKAPFRKPEDIGRLRVLNEATKRRLIPLATIGESGNSDRYTSDRAFRPGNDAEQNNQRYRKSIARANERFPFDPNTLSGDSLLLLGFTEREVNALIKYRSYREITFREPEDLKRLGALDASLVADLLSYVRIDLPDDERAEPTPYSRSPSPATPPAPSPGLIDVNAVDIAALTQLPGIGEYRAKRILKFRDLLGGFVSVEQVGTTYSLPDSTFRRIQPYLITGPLLRQIDINRVDAEELGRHPYVKAKLARTLVRYRDIHGPYAGAADLEKVRALSAENRARLLPYLNFAP